MARAKVHYLVYEGNNFSKFELALSNSAFDLTISQGRAVFSLKFDVASLDQAINYVTDYMASLEADMALQTGPVRRVFWGPSVKAPGLGERGPDVRAEVRIGGPHAEAIGRQLYPWKNYDYSKIPLIASLIERYAAYGRGEERISVLGYLVLSALETTFDDREGVAKTCKISGKVLKKFAGLVSGVGSYQSARKISSKHRLREFTERENYWLETVTRQLIDRAGAAMNDEADRLTALDMEGLPPLR